jgi:hypothetical protein
MAHVAVAVVVANCGVGEHTPVRVEALPPAAAEQRCAAACVGKRRLVMHVPAAPGTVRVPLALAVSAPGVYDLGPVHVAVGAGGGADAGAMLAGAPFLLTVLDATAAPRLGSE